MSRWQSYCVCSVALLLLEVGGADSTFAQSTERISISTSGRQSVDNSDTGDISRYGAIVTFTSGSKGLVPSDTNHDWDVFARIRSTGTTRRISVAEDGSEGPDESYGGAISPNGRFIAFNSWSALVPADTDGFTDVYVRDRLNQSLDLVSVSTSGAPADGSDPVISADGRYVAFLSSSALVDDDLNENWDIYVFDRVTRLTERVSVSTGGSEGNGYAFGPSISDNGRYVSFYSSSDNLVPGDTNGVNDVFVRDRINKVTRRVSVNASGQQGNGASLGGRLSADGKLIAFSSLATNLVPNDTNGVDDAFISGWKTRTIERVSVSSLGGQGNEWSTDPDLSADGRFVVFTSYAGNLVPGDTNGASDVFLRDRVNGTTRRVSVSTDNLQSNGYSDVAVISPDGQYVAFRSDASNLVPFDTNHQYDVFLRDLGPIQARQQPGNRR